MLMRKGEKFMRYFIVCLILIAFSSAAAWSADQPKIAVQLTALKVVRTAHGQEVLSSGDSAKPGEVLEYRIEYRNTGKSVARNLQGALPIPAEMEFVSGSALPVGASASLDGKKFTKIPLYRQVKLADGSTVTREVPATEYVSLRWNFPDLEPGSSITAKARMRIRNSQTGPVFIKNDSNNK